MLHLCPDPARKDRTIDFQSARLECEGAMTTLTPEGGGGFGWEMLDLHKQGALGDAGAATAAIGKAILEHQARPVGKTVGRSPADRPRGLDVAPGHDKPIAGG
jgi:creatinine amidohydrolase